MRLIKMCVCIYKHIVHMLYVNCHNNPMCRIYDVQVKSTSLNVGIVAPLTSEKQIKQPVEFKSRDQSMCDMQIVLYA